MMLFLIASTFSEHCENMWQHDMEMFSILLSLCERNPLVIPLTKGQ